MRSPSVHVDWSLYGGAESTAPPPGTRALAAAAGPARSVPLAASSSSSSLSSADDSDARLTPSGSSLHSSRTSDTSDADEPADAAKRAPKGTDWLPQLVPARSAAEPVDFLWLHTEEPHRSRRRAILAAHPEVRALMGHEPRTKYIACAVTALQTALAVYFGRAGFAWNDWRLLLVAYVVGGTANQNTFLAIHEITHNLAFRGLRANKALAVLVNCCIGVPYSMLFKVSRRIEALCSFTLLTLAAAVPH
jgi:sphingolipid delta-4 desaturase